MKRVALLVLLGIFSLCIGQDSWSVAFKGGNIDIRYKGIQLVNTIEVSAFQPDYKAQLFTMRKADYRQEGGKHVLHNATDVCDATVTISFEGSQMVLEMESTMFQNIPYEYSVCFPPKSLQLQNGSFYFRQNNRTQLFSDGEIESFQLKNDFSIEQERFTHAIEHSGDVNLTFQDKRNANGKMRVVSSFRPGNRGNRVTKRIVWTVREHDAAQGEFRAKYALAHASKSNRLLVVDNAEFEQEGQHWSFPKNVTFEQVDAKHGKSARMDVEDPMVDSVYINRFIPVMAGTRYFAQCDIRTKDVAMAKGKMASVGACLIIEWADKDKKWLASGVYSRGLWGTSDWKTVECRNLRAPEGACYAYVYIALRAKGTAWYDKFRLYALEESAVKCTPGESEVVKTNAPRLSWLHISGVDSYEVMLSQNPDFPAGETKVYTVDVERELQLREALKPGTWYWRVNAFGFPDHSPASFIVDTPPEASLIPPEVVAKHTRLLEPAAFYPFSIRSQEAIQSVAVADADAPETAFEMREMPGKQYFARPKKGWKSGLNTITITATAPNGASETRKIWIVCAPKPEQVVVIDQEGRYTENGKHIFPLGIYEVSPKLMPEVKAAGFEVVHTYRWESSQDEEGAKAYLDAAHAAGLRVFIGFDRGIRSLNGIVQGNLDIIAKRIGKLASHPGLFCWYLFDEPEVAAYYVPPKRLTAFAELARALDPYHPVVMTTWGKKMNDYRKTWDTHWSQCYHRPADIVKLLAEHRELLHNASPITLLIHSYDREQTRLLKNGKPVDWEHFAPDYDWMRAAAMVGIAKEVNGLWWWWYAKDAKEWMTTSKNPRTWAYHCKVVDEVRSLRPVLNAEGPVQTGTVAVGDAKVEWWLKTVNGKNTVIIVNTSETDVETTITPKGCPPIPVKLGRYGVVVSD